MNITVYHEQSATITCIQLIKVIKRTLSNSLKHLERHNN